MTSDDGITAAQERTPVYTDGACSGNPGPGGWAWVVPDGPYASGGEVMTTNQRMELTAALEAVTTLDHPLEVISDSSYVVNCFRDGWWEGWISRGWVNSKRQPVANRDLWEPLVQGVREGDVTFRWVKGHAGNRWNDMADGLAVEAAAAQATTSAVPTAVPGSESAPSVRSDDRPDGRLLMMTGHRPPELGGYGATDAAWRLRTHLGDIITAKWEMHNDLRVLTGMGLGTEMLAAEAAQNVGVPYVAVLAYPGTDEPWPRDTKRRFGRVLANADEVVTLQKRAPESRQKMVGAYARRDAWLRRHADEAVVVWDGEEAYLAKTVKAIQDELGEEDVWIVDPRQFVRS